MANTISGFYINPEKLFCDYQFMRLSFEEKGRLFEQLCEAVKKRDRRSIAVFQKRFIGKIVWPRAESRPPIPLAIRMAVFERDKGKCQHCASTDLIEFDHIKAYSKGGKSTAKNLQLLCRSCNRKKGAN